MGCAADWKLHWFGFPSHQGADVVGRPVELVSVLVAIAPTLGAARLVAAVPALALAKPTGAVCNLDCAYFFLLSEYVL